MPAIMDVLSPPSTLLTTNNNTFNDSKERSYKELIKQLAAQVNTKPYGNIPPMSNNNKRKKKKKIQQERTIKRRMSHVEDWVVVDSKESIPDEEELNSSTDFSLTHVLPLHMPPPSLSEIQQDTHLLRSLITTQSYAISSSPPQLSNIDQQVWNETIAKLKKSLVVSSPTPKISSRHIIPLPPPPRKLVKRRRSEATTQPRFNPDTNAYTRDTRSNPDHLRMISAELNMIRSRKLLSPLKPRGFLPRRKDIFIRGEHRKVSPLTYEIN